MSKIVLDEITSGYQLSKVNENFQRIEDELNNKVLYRNAPDGETNTVEKDIDLNGKKLYNVGDIQFQGFDSLEDLLERTTTAAEESEASKDAAEVAAENAAISAASASTYSGSAVVRTFSGDGSTVAFNLTASPLTKENTQVYIGSVYQRKSTYSVTDNILTFNTAPPVGTNNIEVVIFESVFVPQAGYTIPVAYSSGIVLSQYNQLVEYNSEFYKLKAGQAPYTTTGTWESDSEKLVAVGDAALRQELLTNANDFNLIPEVANYAAVRAGLGDLEVVYVRGRSNIFDGGFGVFRLKVGDTTTADNDGTVLVDSVSGARYFREFSGWCDALWFGAIADGTDVTVELQAAITAYPYVDLPAGVIRHSRLVLKHQNQILRGKGRDVTILYCPSGYAITNYSGADSDPIGSDWVGNPTFEKLTLRGGFTHTDDFSAPSNSWALSTGRAKTFTTTGINAGLRLKRCYPYTLNEVNIEHFHRGVYASAAALGRWSNFEVSDCEYGMYGENGAVWGESAWQVTTHRWSQGRFKNCWIGIGGSDFVQCQVDKKTVDFEPCNTGIAITNGGDNVWSGYFELCSEGIYRTGGDMGHDIIEDPFFAGAPGAFWGSGDSILMDSGIGASGKVTLRHGLGKINGGGLRVLGGRIVQPERAKFGATLYLSPELTPSGGYSATDVQWGLSSPADDVLGVYSASAPTRVTIPAELHGARIRLKTNLEIAGDTTANDVLISFHKNGAPFSGSGQFSGVFQYGRTISFETAPLTVSAGDYFTLVVLMNLSRTLPTGGHCWLSLEVLE